MFSKKSFKINLHIKRAITRFIWSLLISSIRKKIIYKQSENCLVPSSFQKVMFSLKLRAKLPTYLKSQWLKLANDEKKPFSPENDLHWIFIIQSSNISKHSRSIIWPLLWFFFFFLVDVTVDLHQWEKKCP